MRSMDGVAWSWQEKQVVRFIRNHFDDSPTKTASALALYLALTEVASNRAKDRFQCTHAELVSLSGLSRSSVISILKQFEIIDVVDIERIRVGQVNLPSIYTLLACPTTEQGVENTTKESKHLRITEKKKRKNAEPSGSEYSSEFLRFWKVYPKKVGKGAAWKAFLKLDPDAEHVDKMVSTIELWKKSKEWTKDDGQFIPHPTTWLNQGRWEDELSKDDMIEEEESDYIPNRTFDDDEEEPPYTPNRTYDDQD